MSNSPAPALNIPGDGTLHATFKTSMGDITAVLHEHECPQTINNFVALATGAVEWTTPSGSKSNEPLYSGIKFHRVIPQFMIQGGCPEGTGRGGPGWRFKDEFVSTLRHDKPGILSMANAGPGTNGSQFFLTEVPTPHLDGKHTVFGEVVEGVELITQIAGAGNGVVTLNEVAISRR